MGWKELSITLQAISSQCWTLLKGKGDAKNFIILFIATVTTKKRNEK